MTQNLAPASQSNDAGVYWKRISDLPVVMCLEKRANPQSKGRLTAAARTEDPFRKITEYFADEVAGRSHLAFSRIKQQITAGAS